MSDAEIGDWMLSLVNNATYDLIYSGRPSVRCCTFHPSHELCRWGVVVERERRQKIPVRSDIVQPFGNWRATLYYIGS